MSLFLRPPFPRADARESAASWTLTLFVMILFGFVAYELCTDWASAKTLFLAPAGAIAESVGLDASNGWIKGAWTLGLFPLVLWLVLGGLVIALRGAHSLGEAWRGLVGPLIPLLAAGHMAKGLAKVASWGGFVPLALEEPGGVESAEAITAEAITAETLALPQHLLTKPAVALIAVGLVALFAGFAFRENTMAQGRSRSSRIVPFLVVAELEIYLVWGWGFGR